MLPSSILAWRWRQRAVGDAGQSLQEGDRLLGGRQRGRPAAELADACAGWPAAIRLALSAPSPRWWEEQLLDFVTEEILRRPDARAFLLHTALLEELSPSVCDALLESDGSAAMLADLERRHLLVEGEVGRAGQRAGDPAPSSLFEELVDL